MRIEHAAIYVKDIEQSKDFFVRYFGAVSNEMYHNPKTGLRTYFLTFDGGSRLELMTRPDLCPSVKNPLQCGFIHIAFSVGSKEKVDSLTETLRKDGYCVVSGPRTTGDGCYESCVKDKEDNLIEITI